MLIEGNADIPFKWRIFIEAKSIETQVNQL